MSGTPDYPDVESPYKETADGNEPHKYVPHLESLDNSNVIIIFENSTTNKTRDTLIAARQQWESRWRRLPFYLGVESNQYVFSRLSLPLLYYFCSSKMFWVLWLLETRLISPSSLVAFRQKIFLTSKF